MTHAAATPSTIRRRIVLLCLVLAAALALLWLTPAPLAGWKNWRAPAPQPPALDEFERAALTPRAGAGVPQEALQRPLFQLSRRPVPKASEEDAAVPALDIEQAQLRGLVDADGVSGAFVELDGATHFVHVGEVLPGTGWRLAALQGRAARFENGVSSHELELPFLENLGAPPEPPKAAPQTARGRRR